MRAALLRSRVARTRYVSSLRLLHRPCPAQASRSYATNVLSTLESRGLIKSVAGDRSILEDALLHRQVGVYAGIDPTAPSLHLGHLLPLMVLFWLYVHGHHTVSLIGGGTAQVGDPSGRLLSRATTAKSTHESNTEALQKQVELLWARAEAYGGRHGYIRSPHWKRTLLNNADWLMKLNVIEFSRVLGSGMRIGAMLGRDTVRNKMEKGDGMSHAEFTYPLFQGWDWWHMFRNHDIQLQVGGSDQYGNIIAGMEAVKHCAQSSAGDGITVPALGADGRWNDQLAPMGLTTPLLTTSKGEKFGKSAGNAVWLDPTMTTAFDLYGFLLGTSDEDVARYLELFTFVPSTTITATMVQHKESPALRQAQHLLAAEVTELVHGVDEARRTAKSHKSARGSTMDDILQSQEQRLILKRSDVADSFAKTLFNAGLVSTISAGTRLISSGGVYAAVLDVACQAQFRQVLPNQKPQDLLVSNLLLLRLGKWKVHVIEISED